jgi:diguanylate cyclase (GGDEF)-like protein/PAS domain S-box-containing protein
MVLGHRPAVLKEFLVCVILTAGLSLSSIVLARSTGGPTSLWLADGVAIGWVIRRPLSEAWLLLVAFFLGYVAARVVLGDTLIVSGLLGACNAAEIFIVKMGIRRYFPTITNDTSVFKLSRVAFVSALVGCGISALGISFVQSFQPQTSLHWTAFSALFRSHLLGMVIAGSMSFFVVVKGWHPLGPRKGRGALILNLLLLTATTSFVFLQPRYPLLFLIYPALLMLIFRHRFSGMLLGIAVIALVTTVATALKFGPFDLVVGAPAGLRVVMAQVFIGTCCLVAMPVVLALAEQKRLQREVIDSELRYRTLADNSGDLVMRIQPNGDRQYVSPSIKELLGWEIGDFLKPRPDLIHPDDRTRIAAVVKALRTHGGTTTATYRLRHQDGHYIWIEAFARLIESPDGAGTRDIIYSGRDVTKRVLAEQALVDSRTQLRTITDNIPAVIARIDPSETYTYINRYVEQVSGEKPSDIVGKTVKEVRGMALYEQLRGPLHQALAGESIFFEYEATYGQRLVHFQTHYVPDKDADGKVCGVYALTTNITHIKDVERELSRLAHYDSLTGLANRRYFNDRAPVLIDAALKQNGNVLLVLLDIDHFKAINDTWGHAAGDAVLAEVGRCLQKRAGETFLVARLGGDEFVVLCSNHLDEGDAEIFVQSLWSELHLAVLIEGLCIDVNISIGAVLCKDEQSRSILMKCADEALYEAKDSGRNTYRIIFKRNVVGSSNAL